MLRLMGLFLVFGLFSQGHAQETLKVGVAEVTVKYLPSKVAKMKRALASTGLEFEYFVVPSKLGLQKVAKGEFALTLFRQTGAVRKFNNLIRVTPRVSNLKLHYFTRLSNADLCELQEYEHQSVVGITGAIWFENYIYQKFYSYKTVSNFNQALNMVKEGMVDFGVLNIEAIKEEEKNLATYVHICRESPALNLPFYTYVHKKYIWALPKIEIAYREYFSNDNK